MQEVSIICNTPEKSENTESAIGDSALLNVHSIESFGTYDGPGIRYVIFLQGCPFKCLYCSNPDTMNYHEGDDKSVETLYKEVLRMKPYFSNGGGVTVSGGEPCSQAKSLIPLFTKLKEAGIHTALDTNGNISNHYVEDLLNVTDLVLLDVKHIDPRQHEHITGRSNKKTLAMADHLRKIDKPFWLRYVLVPGLSDDPADMRALGEHFSGFTNLKRIEIQPYHTFGKHKWSALGMGYPLEGVPENTPQQLEQAKALFEAYVDEVVVN